MVLGPTCSRTGFASKRVTRFAEREAIHRAWKSLGGSGKLICLNSRRNLHAAAGFLLELASPHRKVRMVSSDDEQTVRQTLAALSLRRLKKLCSVFVCRAPSLILGASIRNTNDERAVWQSAPARSIARQTEDGERPKI